MAEVKLPAPVRATLVPDIDERLATPGAFNFYIGFRDPPGAAPKGMVYVCPCGCGQQGALEFKPAPSPSWTWDGNREAPTLHPSIHHVGHWHGWLQKGFFRQQPVPT